MLSGHNFAISALAREADALWQNESLAGCHIGAAVLVFLCLSQNKPPEQGFVAEKQKRSVSDAH